MNILSLLSVLAASEGQGDLLGSLLGMAPLILIVIAFFWLMSRSQKKKERQRQEMLDTIKPKDRVVTIGGIHGKIVRLTDDGFVVRIDDEKDVKITLAKSGISRKLNGEQTES